MHSDYGSRNSPTDHTRILLTVHGIQTVQPLSQQGRASASATASSYAGSGTHRAILAGDSLHTDHDQDTRLALERIIKNKEGSWRTNVLRRSVFEKHSKDGNVTT